MRSHASFTTVVHCLIVMAHRACELAITCMCAISCRTIWPERALQVFPPRSQALAHRYQTIKERTAVLGLELWREQHRAVRETTAPGRQVCVQCLQ